MNVDDPSHGVPGPVELPPAVTAALPRKLGYSDAADRVGSTAAPLLAGFGMALVGLVVGSEGSVRWPSAALALLVIAVLLLVAAVQASFNARSWYISPGEFLTRLAATPVPGRNVVTGTYVQGIKKHRRWLLWTRHLYNIGIMALLAGLALVVVPRGTIDEGRIAVIVLSGAGFAVELIWWIATFPTKRPTGAETPEAPEDR